MNLENITHEQLHAILALTTLNLVLFIALLSSLEANFVFSCWPYSF